MNLEYETSFTVYPGDTNDSSPLIFGGAFFSHLDKAAATAVRRLLYESETCKGAVTHVFDGKYLKPCYMGDLIFIKAEIVSLGVKSVVVETKAYRERLGQRELVAYANYVFVTISDHKNTVNKPDMLPYMAHGLTMPSKVNG